VGGTFPESLFVNFLFAKRSLPGQAGASRTSKGRDVVLRGIPPFGRAGCPPRLYKPEPASKILFYSAKIRKKKERKERKREEEAAKPCSHVDLEVYSHSSCIIT
jgi:hypothetical protein